MKVPYGKKDVKMAFEELMSAGAPKGEKKDRLDEFLATLAFLEDNALVHKEVAKHNGISPDTLVASPNYKEFMNDFYSRFFAKKAQELEKVLECANVQAWGFLLAYAGLLDEV